MKFPKIPAGDYPLIFRDDDAYQAFALRIHEMLTRAGANVLVSSHQQARPDESWSPHYSYWVTEMHFTALGRDCMAEATAGFTGVTVNGYQYTLDCLGSVGPARAERNWGEESRSQGFTIVGDSKTREWFLRFEVANSAAA